MNTKMPGVKTHILNLKSCAGLPSVMTAVAGTARSADTTIRAQPAASTPAPTPTAKLPFATPLHWKSTGVLLKPVSDETHNLVSVKDPTVVRYDNKWHVYATTANT
jgi:endo-1,4-beta-xylanase